MHRKSSRNLNSVKAIHGEPGDYMKQKGSKSRVKDWGSVGYQE